MRVLVCGSLDYTDEAKIHNELDKLWWRFGNQLVVIEGQARGADRIAGAWADKKLPKENHVKFPAQWKIYGRGAGPIRNKQMLEQGQPYLVLAFGGKDETGTNDMVRKAKKAGVLVKEYDR